MQKIKYAEPTVSHDRPEQDLFKNRLNSFSGETAAKQESFVQNHNVHQYLAGLFSQKKRSAKVLSQVLSESLHHPVTIDEFQGRWYTLEPTEFTRLGKANACLGMDSIAGNRTFQRSFNFAIKIGPVDYSQYMALLKNNQRIKSIVSLTQKAVGQEYEFTIQILLKAYQTQTSQLGSTKLGINSWCQDKSHHLTQHDPILVYKTAC